MSDIKKYQGIFPAFYACYDDSGAISPERTRSLARYLAGKGIKGLTAGRRGADFTLVGGDAKKLTGHWGEKLFYAHPRHSDVEGPRW